MIDELLAERVRDAVGGLSTEPPKKMFGGLAFMVGGHMAVCTSAEGLLVRTTDVSTHVRDDGSGPVTAMVMSGRTSRTWLRIAPEVLADDVALRKWVSIGVAVAASLPPKDAPADAETELDLQDAQPEPEPA